MQFRMIHSLHLLQVVYVLEQQQLLPAGMKPEDMDKIAEAIAMTLKEEGSQEKAKAIVKELTDKYPLVG